MAKFNETPIEWKDSRSPMDMISSDFHTGCCRHISHNLHVENLKYLNLHNVKFLSLRLRLYDLRWILAHKLDDFFRFLLFPKVQ